MTAIEGLYYLMGRAGQEEFVSRYTARDMVEIFGKEIAARLAAGEEIKVGQILWIDMVAATRRARKEG